MSVLNYHRKWLIAPLFTVAFLLGNCKNDKDETLNPGTNPVVNCATIPSSFSANVFPLIQSKCAIATCHDATAQGGMVFQNYSQVSAAKDRIRTRAVNEKTMPPTGALPAAEINIIRCWIESGAPNN